MSNKHDLARQVVCLIPGIFKTLAPEIRCLSGTVAHPHFRILHMLARQPASLSELAEWQAVTLATMSNSVDTLEQRGWLLRIPESHDRRKIRVEITPLGQEILAECEQQLLSRLDQKLGSLDETEMQELERGLAILNKVISQPTKEEGK